MFFSLSQGFLMACRIKCALAWHISPCASPHAPDLVPPYPLQVHTPGWFPSPHTSVILASPLSSDQNMLFHTSLTLLMALPLLQTTFPCQRLDWLLTVGTVKHVPNEEFLTTSIPNRVNLMTPLCYFCTLWILILGSIALLVCSVSVCVRL